MPPRRKARNPRRAVAYVRVSSLKQAKEGLSLEAQQRRILAYTVLKDFDLDEGDIFVEDGVSGTVPLWERPKGVLMQKRIEETNASHIIGVRLDRLFRDTKDCLFCVDEMQKDKIHLHLIDFQDGPLDTSSSTGRLFLQMTSIFAEFERNQIAERTQAAMDHLKQTHKRFTHSMYGWDITENGSMVPAWEEQTVIDWMKEMYYDHDISASAIAKELNDAIVPTKNDKRWHNSTVLRVMKYEFHEERRRFAEPDWFKGIG